MSAATLTRRHSLFGWSCFLAGVIAGMVMGTWSFDGPLGAPQGFTDYGSLARRFLRLGHIAAMALGLANVVYGAELAKVRLSDAWKRLGSAAMLAAAVLMPLILGAAAFDPRWKWGLPLPASCALAGVSVVVIGLARRQEGSEP